MGYRHTVPAIRLSDALAAGTANRFGLVRLTLAALVIVSHAPLLLDGDNHREPLFKTTGTMTVGEVAVMGFFFVSGLLVTASYNKTPDLVWFCRKRAARIVPGFCVAYLATLLIAGPLAGGHLGTLLGQPGLDALARLLLLQQPTLEGAFAAAADPRMNQSLWTIPYETMCYVLTAFLGATTLLFRLRPQLWLICLVELAVLTEPWHALPLTLQEVIGNPRPATRLLAVFLTGACAFHLRAALVLDRRIAVLTGIVFSFTLFVPALLFTLGAACGGYTLLWLVFAGHPGSLAQKTDISYGLYLYGWPVQNTLVVFFPDLSPFFLIVATLPVAATLGYLSWTFVEHPALSFAKRRPVHAVLS